MTDSQFKKTRLSPEGETRRREMLEHLKLEMKSVHEQRSRFRTGAIIAGCLAVTLLSIRFFGGGANPPAGPIVDNGSEDVIESVAKMEFQFVKLEENREDVSQKYVVSRDQPSRLVFESIDDQQLAQELTEAGKPSVVGRIDGEIRIVSLD